MMNLRSGGLATSLLGRTGLATRLPRHRYLARGPSVSHSIALTFDDGPHPVYTPPLLDALRQEGIFATFFVIGREAERHPDLVRRIDAEGHAIGSHTFTHSDPAHTPRRRFLNEVAETHSVVAAILGRKSPSLMRPPFGRLGFGKLLGLWWSGESIIVWNVDLKDYVPQPTSDVVARLRAHSLSAGDIILMHDNHPHAAVVVPEIADRARTAGLGFSTITPWTRAHLTTD